MAAQRLQYHELRPYCTMQLLRPVFTSMLDVRWHLEQRARSKEDVSERLEEEERSDRVESSLVACSTFCTGWGRGRLEEPECAAAVCICRMVDGAGI